MSITLTEEALKARREYKRNWNRRNKDKVKAYQQKYWEKKAAAAAPDPPEAPEEGVFKIS